MATFMEMSLEDIIKRKKKQNVRYGFSFLLLLGYFVYYGQRLLNKDLNKAM